MGRRLALFILISILFTLSWSALVSKVYHIDNKEVTQPLSQITPTVPTPVVQPNIPPAITAAALVNFTHHSADIIFIEPKAAIKEIRFKNYADYKFGLGQGFALQYDALVFSTKNVLPPEVNFTASNQEVKVTQRFLFANSNYNIDLEIKIDNLSDKFLDLKLPLVLGVLNFVGDPNQVRFQDVTIVTREKTLRLNGRKDASFEAVKFIGLRDRYFCAIIEPESDGFSAYIKKIAPQEAAIGLILPVSKLMPGQSANFKFHIYLGPQELRLMNSIKPAWSVVINYGLFDFIAHMLLQLLGGLYLIVKNWGLAVILLSLIIYFALFPLTLKQMHSMKKMQALQPLIEELRRTYKDNPQRLNKEIMQLYAQHKVNPLAGCLPLLLQMPIFFSLYQALMRSVVLKGARFLWIKDLSEPDRLWLVPANLPFIGKEINILPILMAIGMFIQQKATLALSPTTGGTAEQQKLMVVLFPVIFGLIFYHMPAGLVLYWFINSILMLVYQLKIAKIK